MTAPADVLAVMRNAAIEGCCTGNAYFAPETDEEWNRVVANVLASKPIADLIAYADSALHYVDEAAKIERERHQRNGAPNSQVLAQTVADNLRAALARVGGGK